MKRTAPLALLVLLGGCSWAATPQVDKEAINTLPSTFSSFEVAVVDDKHDEMWIARMQLPHSDFRKKLPKESLKYRHDHLLTWKYDWANLDKTFLGDNDD